jgi:hypothetical protein
MEPTMTGCTFWTKPRAATAAALLAAAAFAAPAAHAAGKVVVNYLQPEQFADIGRSSWDRERTLKTLSSHFEALAARLPEGQTLRIEVTEVDLAGEIRPWGWHELRVMRGTVDWPTLGLRYTLQQGDRTLKSGEERISDMNYLHSTLQPRDRADTDMAYERRLVRRWFEATFTAAP